MPSAKQVSRDKQQYDKFKSEKMYRSSEYNQMMTERLLAALVGGLVALAIGLLALLPAAAGYGLYRTTRDQLSSRDYAIVAAADLLVMLLWWPAGLDRYATWVWDIGPGAGSPWAVPVLPIILLAVLFGALTGTISGTRILGLVPFIRNRNAVDGSSLVPDDHERARIDTVTPPPATTQVDPTQTTLASQDTGVQGSRGLPVGVRRDGSPYAITEKELGTHAVMLGATGSGKALALDTPIVTPDGWTTMGDLQVGDTVFGADGRPTTVTFATGVQHDRRCYEVAFSDGEVIVADADHRWMTWTRAARISEQRAARNEPGRLRRDDDHRDQRHKRSRPAVVNTEQIRQTLRHGEHTNHSIEVAAPLQFPTADLPLAPYVLGLWLGDGRSRDGGVILGDDDADELLMHLEDEGMRVTSWAGAFEYGIDGILPTLRELGVLTENQACRQATSPRVPFGPRPGKHIPDRYLQADVEQRLALLQGLMDADGTVGEAGACEFTSCNAELAADVHELVVGLGIKARQPVSSPAKIDGRTVGTRWRMTFTTNQPVFRLKRKRDRLPTTVRPTQQHRYIVDIRPVDSVPVRCITVDNDDHLYLAGRNCVPTHNTESIKTVASRLLDLGWDGVLIDLKEDTAPGGLRDFCRTYASARQAPYQEVCLSDPESPYWFNSLYGLGPDEARDAIISMQDFEAPHWAEVGKRLIGQLVTLMYDAHKVDPGRFAYPDIYTMGQIFSKGKGIPAATKSMRAIVRQALPGRTEDDFFMLAQPDDLAVTAAPGLGNRLTSIYETQAGRQTLRPNHDRHPQMDVTADGLAYLGLNSLGLPQLSRAISSSALLRLAAYAGQRTQSGSPRPKFIIIDEANFLDTEITLNILSRARSAGIATVLCSQSPKDFDREVRKGKPGFAQLAQNINVAVVMRQGEPESAEVAADYLGKHKVKQLSSRVIEGQDTGEGTAMLREEHKVTPQQLMELRVGEAIIKVGVPTPRIDWVKVALTEL